MANKFWCVYDKAVSCPVLRCNQNKRKNLCRCTISLSVSLVGPKLNHAGTKSHQSSSIKSNNPVLIFEKIIIYIRHYNTSFHNDSKYQKVQNELKQQTPVLGTVGGKAVA